MMDQAKLEEAAGEAWDRRGALQVAVAKSSAKDVSFTTYHLGFLAGARWRDKQPIIIGVDLASGPDRMVIWPNAEADLAAEDEG